MSNWQTVFQTGSPHRADIVKEILAEKDIQAVVVNLKDQLYHFGDIEVRVAPDYVIMAKKIIAEEVKFDND